MPFSIIYLRDAKWVGDATWAVEIPPSCNYVRYSLQVHEADTAIITDEDGYHSVILERQKFDS
jgi:hypothetical protein